MNERELSENVDPAGADRQRLARWTHTVVTALAAARGEALAEGPDTDDQAAAAEWWAQAAAVLHTDALPRLEALRDACVAAHEAAGGSYGDLAVALGRARDDRALAQRLRTRAADTTRPHHHWPTAPARDTAARADEDDLRVLFADVIEILVPRQRGYDHRDRAAYGHYLRLVDVDMMAQTVVDLYANADLGYMGREQKALMSRARRTAMARLAAKNTNETSHRQEEQ